MIYAVGRSLQELILALILLCSERAAQSWSRLSSEESELPTVTGVRRILTAVYVAFTIEALARSPHCSLVCGTRVFQYAW
jgi:hypothetical protein